MQQDTVYLNPSTAQHVFGWYFTHHQELITLYLQYLALNVATYRERGYLS